MKQTIESPAVLGQTIRAMRKRASIRQADLAVAAGTNVRFIVDLEKGKPTCQLGKVLDVLNALGAGLQLTEPDMDSSDG